MPQQASNSAFNLIYPAFSSIGIHTLTLKFLAKGMTLVLVLLNLKFSSIL